MVASKNQIFDQVDSETYPLGEKSEHLIDESALALLALSHTVVEHRLYSVMLAAANGNGHEAEPFTARRLMALADIRSISTVRRGLEGLITKLSVERERVPHAAGGNGREFGASYRVFPPDEVMVRRQQLGEKFYGARLASDINHSFDRAISRVAGKQNLSRREAQVALCCVEGLTNAEIGNRLQVSEQTVKFHLRHVFIKFGVKRRAELISRLLI
jgi:DNA-binding CsgD family transcriptional regulator